MSLPIALGILNVLLLTVLSQWLKFPLWKGIAIPQLAEGEGIAPSTAVLAPCHGFSVRPSCYSGIPPGLDGVTPWLVVVTLPTVDLFVQARQVTPAINILLHRWSNGQRTKGTGLLFRQG